ncbi:MAG: hypothetical protein PHQ34_09295 [Methanothrix sp.]|nr:hypothetical protein [Methanothrix sp.]
MKKTRRSYDREFKLSVIAELEVASLLFRLPASRGFIRVFHLDGEMNS